MTPSRRAVAAGVLLAGFATAGQAEDFVTFPAADGPAVAAARYGRGRTAVLLVPGANGVGEAWDLHARRLARAGFRVMTIDYRGLGRSPAPRQDSERLPIEIAAAAGYLRASGAERVFAVGASYGGSALGVAGVANPGLIDRFVFLSCAVEQAERLAGRKLFLVAENDRDGSGRRRLDAIRRNVEAASEPKALVALPGAAHAQLIFLGPHAEPAYREIERFLKAR